MQITQISYRTNIITEDDRFRSKHVEATATLKPGEDPAEALIELARWVHRQLGIERQIMPALRRLGDE